MVNIFKNTQHTHNIMVYETKTLELCHGLTPAGEQEYGHMLELLADEILFRSKHPLKYWTQRLMNLLKTGDSTWDGAHYEENQKYKDGYSYVR